MKRRLVAFVLAILAVLAGYALTARETRRASAVTCTNTWLLPVSGSWSTASNWSALRVPDSSDSVCIGTGILSLTLANFDVTLSESVTVADLNVAAGTLANPSLKVTSGTLTVSGNANVGSGGTLILNGGNLTSNDILAVSGTLTVNSGALTHNNNT